MMKWIQMNRPATMRDLSNLKEQIMGSVTASLTQLKADLSALVAKETALEGANANLVKQEQADVAAIRQTVADLRAQLAAGNPITSADLDPLDAQVNSVGAGIQTVIGSIGTTTADVDKTVTDVGPDPGAPPTTPPATPPATPAA